MKARARDTFAANGEGGAATIPSSRNDPSFSTPRMRGLSTPVSSGAARHQLSAANGGPR